MKRRLLLKGAVSLGATLLAEPLLPEAAVAGGSTSLQFFEGTLSGGPFEGWTLWLSATGTRAVGLAFDPASVAGDLQALRLEGRLSKHRLHAEVYARDDLNLTQPI